MAWDVSSWFINEAGTKAPNIVRKLHAAYLKDVSGNGYDAVGFGSPRFIAGTIANQQAVFDGIDDHFSITAMNYAGANRTHGLTIEQRMTVSSEDASGAILVPVGFGVFHYWRTTINITTSSGDGLASLFMNTNVDSNAFAESGARVADGISHMVSMVYDPSVNGGQVKFFVDGASSSITNSFGTTWGSGTKIYGSLGINPHDSTVFNTTETFQRRFKGNLEELRIWHVARTDSEINSFHDTTSLGDTSASSLQLHYDMKDMGDISDRVTNWPTFRRHWSDIRPQSARVSVANDDGYFNNFWLKPQAGLTTFAMEFGFTHPASGDELITPFVGRLGTAHHQRGSLSLTIDDKVSQLSEVIIGTNESPVTYTDSTLPSEMVWDWLTNIGPYSDVASTTNPDINYSSFQDWAGVFSADNIVINGNFSGQKITEALRKMARYTQSAIYMEGGKINFSRFTAVNTSTTFITGEDVLDSSISVQMGRVVTKQIVLAGFNVNSESWAIEATHIDSASSVSYGLRENIERDENIWYTTSVSAVNLAQRYTLIGGNPYEDINTTTTLKPLPRQVGETINFTNDQADISKGYRIMEMEFDMNTGLFNMLINASQTETPFILDQSELDSPDKLL